MTFGGVAAGLLVTLTAAFVARSSRQSEDSSLAAFYLLSLSVGVVIVSTSGSSVDLLHVLFGSVLALDDAALYLLGAIASVSLLVLAVLYRPLVFECVNPGLAAAAGPLERGRAPGLHDAAGPEPGGGLPCARHADVGRA